MNYEQAVDYLNEQKHSVIRPGLTVIRELMKILGDPQNHLRYVHIAGTNGKGSTAAYIERILREAGYRTGLFSSPYIEHFSEKIRIGEKEISETMLIELTQLVKNAAETLKVKGMTPTPFELQTAVAFLFFKKMDCDIVVLETGLGGRLDATNIIENSEVSVITSISYDHMDYLGNSLAEIACEKAGIIKEEGRVVCYPQKGLAKIVIAKRCEEMDASLFNLDRGSVTILETDTHKQVFRFRKYKPFKIYMLGKHQIYNACLAVLAIEVLVTRGFIITDEAIREGLLHTKWKGRLEILRQSPLLLIDGAHNPGGVESLAENLMTLFPEKKITFITGVLRDKDYKTMIKQVVPLAKQFYTVSPNSDRALPAKELAAEFESQGCPVKAFSSVKKAVKSSILLPEDEVICAFGSLYFIGTVRTLVRNKEYLTE